MGRQSLESAAPAACHGLSPFSYELIQFLAGHEESKYEKPISDESNCIKTA